MLFERSLVVGKSDLDVVNTVLSGAECLGNDEVVRKFTVYFGSGFECDVKVVDGDPPYVDAVLFRDGQEVMCLDVRDDLLGLYEFVVGEDTFRVTLVEVVTFLNESLVFEGVGRCARLVNSSLDRAECPSCGLPDCMSDCDGSQGADEANLENEYDAVCRQRYNAGIDTVESLILALVASGALRESESRAVNDAIQACLDALGNKFLG
jgi:hypothetical protein